MRFYSPDRDWMILISDQDIAENSDGVVKVLFIYKKRVETPGYSLIRMIPLTCPQE